MSETYFDLKKRLKGTFVKEIIHLEDVDSTNNYAQTLAQQGYPGGTVVIANKQTKGRGRQNNKWYSPEGNLYMSILFNPVDVCLDVSTLISAFTYLGAISCVNGIYTFCNVKTTLKWPNDIMYSDKKLGGVLTETKISGSQIVSMTMGIGLNINTKPEDFPQNIQNQAISLSQICGRNLDIAEILYSLLLKLDIFYKLIKTNGIKSIFKEWIKHNSTLGRQVRVINGDTIYEGIAQGLDKNGRLLIKSSDSKIIAINNGHLYYL